MNEPFLHLVTSRADPWDRAIPFSAVEAERHPLRFVGIESMVRMEEALYMERWGPLLREAEARRRSARE